MPSTHYHSSLCLFWLVPFHSNCHFFPLASNSASYFLPLGFLKNFSSSLPLLSFIPPFIIQYITPRHLSLHSKTKDNVECHLPLLFTIPLFWFASFWSFLVRYAFSYQTKPRQAKPNQRNNNFPIEGKRHLILSFVLKSGSYFSFTSSILLSIHNTHLTRPHIYFFP